MSLPLYTLSLFLPSIIRDLGYTAAQAQLLTVPPYAFAFLTTLTIAILSEKTHRRAPFILGSSCFAIIGYILLLSSHKPGPSYTGVFFAAGGIYPSVALVLAWPANNVSGQTKRAVANAMQIMIGNLGAVLGELHRTRYELADEDRNTIVSNANGTKVYSWAQFCTWISRCQRDCHQHFVVGFETGEQQERCFAKLVSRTCWR